MADADDDADDDDDDADLLPHPASATDLKPYCYVRNGARDDVCYKRWCHGRRESNVSLSAAAAFRSVPVHTFIICFRGVRLSKKMT